MLTNKESAGMCRNLCAEFRCKRHDLTPCSDTKLMWDDDDKRTKE